MIDDDPETRSRTAEVLDRLALYGWRPGADEPDPRPLPEPDRIEAALADIFDALVATFAETGLEADLEDLLWAATNLFHRQLLRVERRLDGNEAAQRRSQDAQDGSEIRSVELERLIEEGRGLVERRGAYEAMRDRAAELFEIHLGQVWRPRAGSRTSGRALTAALIDSRDHLAARRRAALEPLLPPGPKVAFAGGVDCEDHRAIWAALDRVLAKHPDLVLLHGGAPKGAERIASAWAEARSRPQIVWRPDWARDGRAAPFRRNDRMLGSVPIGLVVFPGAGVTDNLADKARAMGIPLFDFRKTCG